MTKDDWNIIRSAFDDAMALSGEARARFLESFTEEHPDKAGALRELLESAGEDDAFIRSPIESAAARLETDGEDPWIGRVIERYTIIRRIASGGMGSVFLAERADDEFRQRVAIKVMGAQLLAQDAIRRFRTERQILANLTHPNIAGLLDGGTTEEGLPYIVMPYIDGQPVDEYCDSARLGVDRRLELFLRIGEAVDYAHRNLVVHRDLKPSNILVDAAGEPQLLDFGIAKLLEADAVDMTMAMTREGARALTPEYASPEQVRGQPVSVATDVYALGVLLYRLLTGRSPYGDSRRSAVELAHAIVETEPEKPSTAVTRPASASESSADSAADVNVESPDRLRRRLSGDLDNIVLKCLQKDPERRYATVRALLDDIGNYLADRPVSARPDSPLYRARKFAIRHARPLAAAVVVVSVIVALVGYYTMELAAERDAANRERAAADEVADLFVEMFTAGEAQRPDADTITVREVLDQGADRINRELADQPLLRARLLGHIGWTYRSLGLYDDALDALATSVALLERHAGESTVTADSLYRLAHVYENLDRFEESKQALLDALEIHEAQSGENAEPVVAVLRSLVAVTSRLNEKEESGIYLRRMLPLVESLHGNAGPEYARALYSLGVYYWRVGDYEQAVASSRRALDVATRHYGEGAYELAHFHHSVGLNEWNRGDYDAALASYDRALEIFANTLGADHPETFPTLYGRSVTLERLGRLEESTASFERLVELQRAALGPDHPALGFTLGAYGMRLVDTGELDRAEAALRESYRIVEAAHGAGHGDLDMALIGFGHIARARGDFEAAREHYARAMEIRVVEHGTAHPATARLLTSMGELELDAGEPEAAREYFRSALAILEPGQQESGFRERALDGLAVAEQELGP